MIIGFFFMKVGLESTFHIKNMRKKLLPSYSSLYHMFIGGKVAYQFQIWIVYCPGPADELLWSQSGREGPAI